MTFFESFDGIAVEHSSGQIVHFRRMTPGVGRFKRSGTVNAAITVQVDGIARTIDHTAGLDYATPASLLAADSYDPQSRLAATVTGNRVQRLEWLPRHAWPADMPLPPAATINLAVDGTPWPCGHTVSIGQSGFD